MFLRSAQMHARTIEQLAELATLLQAVEEIRRVADVALLQNELEVGKAIEQAAVNDPRDRDHVLEGMSQHPPNRVVRRKRTALRPSGAITRGRIALKRTEPVRMDNDRDVQLVDAGEEGQELRLIQVPAAHIGADYDRRHMQFLYHQGRLRDSGGVGVGAVGVY